MRRARVRLAALAALSALAAACGGRLAATEGAAPAPDASGGASLDAGADVPAVLAPYAVPCDAACPAPRYARAEWVQPDGAVSRCECMPLANGACAHQQGYCTCAFCDAGMAAGPQPCEYDPYYGNVSQALCAAP